MREIAKQALDYLTDNLIATLLIAIIAGFGATKTVAFGKKGNPVLYFVVGLLGAFVGQFLILYLGLKEILEEVSAFRPFFDLLAAYLGSFVFAWIFYILKPN